MKTLCSRKFAYLRQTTAGMHETKPDKKRGNFIRNSRIPREKYLDKLRLCIIEQIVKQDLATSTVSQK